MGCVVFQRKIGTGPADRQRHVRRRVPATDDEAGVEHALLPACKAGPFGHRRLSNPLRTITAAVRRHPDRFSAHSPESIRSRHERRARARTCPSKSSASSAHISIHTGSTRSRSRHIIRSTQNASNSIPDPNADQPIHELQPRAAAPQCRSANNPGRRGLRFPELKIIGIHIGIPWIEEMIAMAWKHQNVLHCCDAYAPPLLAAAAPHI